MLRTLPVLVFVMSLLLQGCAHITRPVGTVPLSEVLIGLRKDIQKFQEAPGGPATNLCMQDIEVVLKVANTQGSSSGVEVVPLKFTADLTGSMENTITVKFRPAKATDDGSVGACPPSLLFNG